MDRPGIRDRIVCKNCGHVREVTTDWLFPLAARAYPLHPDLTVEGLLSALDPSKLICSSCSARDFLVVDAAAGGLPLVKSSDYDGRYFFREAEVTIFTPLYAYEGQDLNPPGSR